MLLSPTFRRFDFICFAAMMPPLPLILLPDAAAYFTLSLILCRFTLFISFELVLATPIRSDTTHARCRLLIIIFEPRLPVAADVIC